MKYIKIYIRVHIYCWLAYLFTLITIPIAWTSVIMLFLYAAFTDKNFTIAQIIASILFVIIGSLPLIVPNYKSSVEMNKYNNKGVRLYFILNQIVSIVPIYICYIICMWLTFY